MHLGALQCLGISVDYQSDFDLSVTPESIECALRYESAVLKLGGLIETRIGRVALHELGHLHHRRVRGQFSRNHTEKLPACCRIVIIRHRRNQQNNEYYYDTKCKHYLQKAPHGLHSSWGLGGLLPYPGAFLAGSGGVKPSPLRSAAEYELLFWVYPSYRRSLAPVVAANEFK